ncbi:hypothetical protein [Burkholderia pseudomallei]|uniref:hypothetical protein n=1 Tax=Burkholderia pseudomallei TaxID=28450 RepID=UPI000A1A3137|nr:hypothetical protein [Burkholderia pseudomallei]ARL21188.1 hypothetical protein BOC47_00940 [Burkholderia pseudomallei]
MFLRNADGSYEPAFFIIRVESDELPEQLAEANESTFVHEYLHLLQDLVMPYCMRENMVLLETFLLQIANAKEKNEMHLPSEYSDEHVRLAKRIGQLTWGGNAFHNNVARIDRIDLQEEAVEGENYKLQKYLLSSDTFDNYHFGARDLLEYIASKIETRHFHDDRNPPDLPYRSVDLIIVHEGLAYLSDVKRIALAEYCLMNDNPARRLMVVIEDIKKGVFNGVDRGDDDAFIQFLSNLEWKAQGVDFRTMADKLTNRYVQLRDTLQRQFPESAFPGIYSWLDEALRYAQESIAGRSLFASLYATSTEQFRAVMSMLLARLGVPLIVNRSGQLGSSLDDGSSKSQFIQLLLAYQFSEYLKRDETTCPLYSNCERDTPEIMNDTDCMDAPFRRALDEELCPFGVFVKAMGLSTVSWYKNGRLIPSYRSGPF